MNTKKNPSATDLSEGFLSGGELTEQEFLKGIQTAEKGPFYTVQESMKQFENWLLEREKK